MLALVMALLAAGAGMRPFLSLLRPPPAAPSLPPASPAPDEAVGPPSAAPAPTAFPPGAALAPSADADLQEASRLFCSARDQNDMARVFLLMRRAAEQGHLDGVEGMATMYENGWGVPQDRGEAVRLWQHAAERGHAVSQYKLGCAYVEPKADVSFDQWQRGVDWLRRAARAGHRGAQEKLRSLGFEPQ